MRDEASKAFQEAMARESSEGTVDWDDVLDRFPEDQGELKRKLAAYRRFFPAKARTVIDRLAAPGKDISGYHILSVLGEGASGVVYLANHPRLNRQVVLKVLRPFLAKRQNVRERFLRESRLVAKLSHAGIMSVEDVGETTDARPFLVMPFFPVASLDKFLVALPPDSRSKFTRHDFTKAWQKASSQVASEKEFANTDSPWIFCAKFGVALAKALLHAHSHGVVHRDVKPGNILIRANGTPIFVDFGLGFDECEAALTMTGDFLGTPVYCPPEAVWGDTKESKDWTKRDLYGLAATLYELATGRPPYLGSDFVTTLQTMRDADPTPALELDPTMPRDLAAILDKGVNKDSGNRYASLAEFADDLEKFVAGEPVKAKPVGIFGHTFVKIKRRRIAVTKVLLVMFVVLFLAGRAFQFAQNSIEVQKSADVITSWIKDNGASALDEARLNTEKNPDDSRAWLDFVKKAYSIVILMDSSTSPEAISTNNEILAAIDKVIALGSLELTPEENFIFGQTLFSRGRYTEAKPILESIVDNFSTNTEVDKQTSIKIENSLGMMDRISKNYKSALYHYQRAAELSPKDDPIPHGYLAMIHNEMGDYNGAIKELDEGLRDDPELYSLHYYRFLIVQEHFPEMYSKLLLDERKRGGEKYNNKILQVSFRPPFGWVARGVTAYNSIVRYEAYLPQSTINEKYPSSVSLFYLNGVFSQSDLLAKEKDMIRPLESGMPTDYKSSSQKSDDSTIIDTSYDVLIDSMKVRVRERAIMRSDGTVFLLVCSTLVEAFEDHVMDFEMTLGSFAVGKGL